MLRGFTGNFYIIGNNVSQNAFLNEMDNGV